MFWSKRKKEEALAAIEEEKALKARAEETELRKKIDLHYGRHNFSSNANYSEFCFYACFDETFNIEGSYWRGNCDGTELFKIIDSLGIEYDKELILATYADEKNQSVEVFHCSRDEQVFAFFDLQKIDTDQNGMFFFGLSCLKTDERRIHEDLLELYRKLNTTSTFNFCYRGGELYNKVFRSYFYFYENVYNADKRQLHHHNLRSPYGEGI